MGFGDLQRMRYPVNVLTTRYYYTGKIEPFGPTLIWLNNLERTAFPLLEFSGAALEGGSAIDTFTRDEFHLLKTDVVAVDLPTAEARETVSLLQRGVPVMLYTERFVFKATLPTSAEARLGELLDAARGGFFAVTQAQIFPVRPARAQVFRTSEMLLVNRLHVTGYHAA